MTPAERRKIIEALVASEFTIMNTKGADYAGNEDTLSNFKRVAALTGTTKYQVWFVYFQKHMDAISNAIKNNPQQPRRLGEPIDDSILDGRVYLTLLQCMLTEDLNNAASKRDKVQHTDKVLAHSGITKDGTSIDV
jgi:hypothetical protein